MAGAERRPLADGASIAAESSETLECVEVVACDATDGAVVDDGLTVVQVLAVDEHEGAAAWEDRASVCKKRKLGQPAHTEEPLGVVGVIEVEEVD